MSWAKFTDAFNTAEFWMKAQELAGARQDERLVTELKGATSALYTHSAQNFTDYRISFGAAVTLLGVNQAERILVDLATIGILKDVSTDSERAYELVAISTFIHLIERRQELMRKKRNADRKRGSLVVPVLLRDGDECRYCSLEVDWDDWKTNDGGTFDHREPDEPTTEDNFVVCCRSCNKLRAELGDEADKELPLLDPPEIPVYGAGLRKNLAKWPRIVARTCARLNIADPLNSYGKMGEPGSSGDPAASRSTTNVTAPTTQSPAPGGTQSPRETRIPELESPQLIREGRAANEAKAHTSSVEVPQTQSTSQSPELPGTQSVSESWNRSDKSARSSGSGNAMHDNARKRGRRRKNRRR